MQTLQPYFTQITPRQWEQLTQFTQLIREWNEKINLVSRKDIDELEERHLLPSLTMSKVCHFAPASKILDVGTGGGFPGIPLAILFPKVNFLLVDSIGKKIRVVEAITKELKLKNVRTQQIRAEEIKENFDFIIGRAVTSLPKFLSWIKGKVRTGKKSPLENGVLYLKGGDLTEEIKQLGTKPDSIYPLEEYFDGKYCQDKSIIYLNQKTLKKVKNLVS